MTVIGMLTWLGGDRSGARPAIEDNPERSAYALTGAVVVLFAVVAGVVAAVAGAAAGWPVVGVVAAAVVVAVLAGTVGKALATVDPESVLRREGAIADRRGSIGRVAVAAVTGVLLAELASTLLFGGTVDRMLDERGAASAASVPAVRDARADLDRARDDRTRLDQTIAQAQADIDKALITARCEYNPTPECPQTRITGVPGRGPESQTAEDMLADARDRHAAALARIAPLDQAVTDARVRVDDAEATALADADRGLGARWVAMHDYTTGHLGPLLLRLLTIIAFVLLALLPLLLRRWRGETAQDRRLAADTIRDRAERTADAAIAVKRAEVRTEAELLRADQQLTAARLAVEADTAIDRERQRTRVIAAIGGLEIGITEPSRRAVGAGATAELPAGAPAADRKDPTVSHDGIAPTNLPAPVGANAIAPAPGALAVPAKAPAKAEPAGERGGLELPLIGQVPFTDTAARWIRPLVPSFVANAIDTATHPLRTARQAFEEVEEITFTLRRTRKVTVDSEDSAAQAAPQLGYQVPPGYQLTPGTPEYWHAQRIAAAAVDPQVPHYYPTTDPRYSALPQASATGYGLPHAAHDELPGRQTPELPGPSGPRELPPGR
ncbi:DUF4407 domain-containing protein [Nocardia cyriacigeorgica]|uniref:DUF4407 domain-containing protein n=1 Tax=Nocardia cyriacigeorgica TaxID=135487 RepID=UPI002491B2FF|nr:DUF4407 domain-containing protein [Nocardia cyriacigeorgica]BDT84280.1 membrane protein [Nocardia cyriacigeorgica]